MENETASNGFLNTLCTFVKVNRRKVVGGLLGIVGLVIGARLVLGNDDEETCCAEGTAESEDE